MTLQKTQELLPLVSTRKPAKAKSKREIEAPNGIEALPEKTFCKTLCGLDNDRRIQSHERLGR